MVKIREARLEDIPLIHQLAHATWPAAYSHILTDDQLQYMLENIYSYPSLEKQMIGHAHDFIILDYNKAPHGFASFSEINPGRYKLHKLYVLPSSQGKGFGKTLLDEVIHSARSSSATSLILNVNRHNKARFFYEKLGFDVIGEEDIDIGQGFFMNDYVMEKKLV
jgi:diamine N-acetyltransferase